jgi:hypothetical protein
MISNIVIKRRSVSKKLLPAKSISTRPSKQSKSLSKFAPFKQWLLQWNGIEKMRQAKDAPVDTMGCGIPIKPNLPKE